MADSDQVRNARRELGRSLAAFRRAAGFNQFALAAAVLYARSTVANVEVGRQSAPPAFWARCDEVLGADGALREAYDSLHRLCVTQRRDEARNARSTALAAAFTTPGGAEGGEHADVVAARDAKPWETAELLCRLQASDTAPATVEALHATTFELCCQYRWRDAVELRAEGHGWLREVARLLRQPTGLAEHRELLVAAGWLALLVGCVEYDLGMRAGAESTRVAARELGEEAGHGELVAWSWEMSAWFALTQGRYENAVTAATAGQSAAGTHTVGVQLIAQEAKARARVGDARGVRAALDRGWHLLDQFPRPERPEHHFVVDPDKWDFYAQDAYRIAGDDDLAEAHARRVVETGTGPDGTERAPMRVAEARLTLGAVAARAGELEQSVQTALTAFEAGRRSLPSLRFVAGELEAELQRRYPKEHATAEYREALRSIS